MMPFGRENQDDWEAAFVAFAARVASLTPEECSALAARHRSPTGESARRWQADQHLILELGLVGFDRLMRAWDVAEPFRGTPLGTAVLDVGLSIIDPPEDPAVAEAAMAAWNDVVGDARQLEAFDGGDGDSSAS